MNRTKLFILPFLIFMSIMVIFPLSLLFWNAFTNDYGFTLSHLHIVLTDGFSMRVLSRSLWIALVAAIVCILIAYPIAYGLTMAGFKRSTTILLLFTLPLWTNLLLRSLALRNLFHLFNFGMGFWAILISLVINFLPITILPIYVVMGNINKKHIEASYDLGANQLQTFRKTILPLSVPGIIASFVLVFTPIVSTYFLSHFFGGGGTDWRMFGELLNRMYGSRNFGTGSVLSIMLLLIMGFTVLILNRFSKVGNKRGGLW